MGLKDLIVQFAEPDVGNFLGALTRSTVCFKDLNKRS